MKIASFTSASLLVLFSLIGCAGNSTPPPAPSSFSLQLAPAAVSVVPGGGSQSLTIGAIPTEGFTGSVSVQVGSLPAGVTATPMTLALMPGTLQQINFTATAAAASGTASISLTAVSGTITQSASAALTIGQPAPAPTFTLAAAPTAVTVTPGGGSRNLTVTATPVNGFTGNVAVQVGPLPTGITATPSTLSLTPGTLQTISVSASSAATAGTASIAFTGTSGTITQNASTALTIAQPPPSPSFSLQASPSAITVVPGGNSRTLTVGATALNGFTGNVSVQVGPLPAGVTATPSTLSLTPGTLQTISVSASSAATAGTASIAFTGASGTITQNASTALTIAQPPPSPSFSLQASPSAITVVPGGNSRTLTVGATALNGFTGNVSVQIGPLPAGVTATPSTLSITPGTLQTVLLNASSAATPGNASISLAGTSGTVTASGSAALTISSPAPVTTMAAISANSFDFGNNLVNNTLTKTVAVVSNVGANQLTLNPKISGDPSYSIAPAGSCGTQLAAGASCNMVVNYNPATASSPNQQTATLDMGFADVPAATPGAVALTGTSATLPVGQVTTTNNLQVALYTMTLPFPGSVTINFGPTTTYGLQTWTKNTDTAGGTVSIFVAGMLASTTYHMQASVQFTNGITATDSDHTFNVPALPASINPPAIATTTPGLTPQPGVEFVNPLGGFPTGFMVTDLSGNTLWAYADPGSASLNYIDGVKMLPNGDFLMVIGANGNAQNPLNGPLNPKIIQEIREVDLGGDTVRTVNLNDLNFALAGAGCQECNVTLTDLHHDVTPLPNGHILILGNTVMALSPTTTPALTNAAPENVLGDVVIDLDQNMHPVWAWNEFNHLDPNRHPMMFPDWTHSNAVVYSPDDANILVSMRHQNWVVKVDYNNGAGTGNILWHLGEGGDFTLAGGTDPTDWQYAQHAPSFTSKNTTGIFSLVLMDNGDDRQFPNGVTPSQYTTIPIFQIDETAKTATILFHDILPTPLYSNFGGNAEQLANGNIEFDLAGVITNNIAGSVVREVTKEANPQTVWTMTISGTEFYRAYRAPSLYPGIQW
jgi:arylsulfate sulfotransferase